MLLLMSIWRPWLYIIFIYTIELHKETKEPGERAIVCVFFIYFPTLSYTQSVLGENYFSFDTFRIIIYVIFPKYVTVRTLFVG